MNVVLLSGGSGKRLWPLSNESNSKQFLRVLRDERGRSESMVQRVFRQLNAAIPNANVLVATNSEQVSAVRKHLGENLDIAVEPARGNTFPAMVLAAAHLKYIKGLHDNEVMIVVPIDVCADIEYFLCLEHMEKLLTEGRHDLVLMGVEPTYPSEKYGYIVPNAEAKVHVVEKPSAAHAETLISKGALWNCGVFALHIGHILDKAHEFIDFSDYNGVLDNYSKLPADSFDYIVAEHEKSIGYVTYKGKWKDLGTWNTLTEEISEKTEGENVILSDDCSGTHVLNMLNKPIIAMGVSNAVIVASHDGILVADKAQSSYIKPYAEKLLVRAMYEECSWGNYRVLDYVQRTLGSSLTKRLHIDAGKSLSYQYHNKRNEIWVIISGEAIVNINGAKQVVESGSVVTIPIGAKHKISAATDVEFIEIQLGDGDLEEDDVVKV